MPYVPSMKTDGKSQDRILIDREVEKVASQLAEFDGRDLLLHMKRTFKSLGGNLEALSTGLMASQNAVGSLALTIFNVGKGYGYWGAFLGELNYAVTRLIQRVPQLKVKKEQWLAKDELRYWLYASTVQALAYATSIFSDSSIGVGGVFEDVKDEYKRRVNVGYEAAQIMKSGDCYDTPYYTRLVEIVDGNGKHVGYQEVMLKRSEETLNKDVLDGKFVLQEAKDAALTA